MSELFTTTDAGPGAVGSPFTCTACGLIAKWRKIIDPAGQAEDSYWLEIPCIRCGKQVFRVTTTPAVWTALCGTNGG